MTKLPTLKDLKLCSCIVEGRVKHTHAGSFAESVGKLENGFLKEDLKQMAIEWVKDIDKRLENKQNTLTEKERLWAERRLIVNLFNLTKQDLKEAKP